MKLDKDKCLGGRLNNQTVTGIRLNGYTIFPIFELSDVYNSYTLTVLRYPTGIYTAYVVGRDCAIDYELRTDWGDGTIDDRSVHTYAEPGEYTIRSNGFLNMEADNDSLHLYKVNCIRPDIVDGRNLFYNYKNVSDFVLPETKYMNDMGFMFYNCKGITDELDLNNFNTSKVTSMSHMFYGCDNMYKIIGIEDWDTSRVTHMNHMFYDCNNLLYLNLKNFDMSRVRDTTYMFYGCNRLSTLNLFNCSYDTIKKIITSEGFPTHTSGFYEIYVQEANLIDEEGNKLEAPSGWEFIYESGETPEEPEIPEDATIYKPYEYMNNDIMYIVFTIVTAEHTDLSDMFYGCRSLTTINYINLWNTSNVTNMNSMFDGCVDLTSLDLSNFNTSNVTDMGRMFAACRSIYKLDLRNFDMSKVTNTNSMFSGCSNLRELRLDNCSKDTISKIINSSNFPTSVTSSGQKRYIYCKRAEASGLTLPGYGSLMFEYVD